MKRLYVLRHAQTQPAGEGGDRERKLTPQGLDDAAALSVTMYENNYLPGFVYCSPVTRTRQTLEQVLSNLGKVPTEFEKIIYEGGPDDLLELVQRADDKHAAVLIVGHNPSIHQFAANLAHDDSPFIGKLATGYAPATLTVLDVPRASWADVRFGENKLIDLITVD